MRKAIVVLLLTTAAIYAQTPEARIEQIIQSYVSDHTFMGTVLIAKGDRVLLDKGYGYANLEWQIPNSPEAKFRLGSVTKQFTAASILLLEERGKLKTDDLIKKYIPDAPAAWDKVTIFHLLTHTSGIMSFTELPEYRSIEKNPATPQEIIGHFKDKPLEFEPGSKFKYSNSGYLLLGYLVDKISGETYPQFLKEHIFGPLGMNDSGYDSNSAIILQRASGYTKSPGSGEIQNAGYIDMTIPYSAGALYSTTGDLLKWEQGLYGGKVLKAESLKKMTTPFKNNYGFGLFISEVQGHKKYDHGGGIEGFNTELAYYPDDRLAVIALANLNGAAPGEIASKAATVEFGGSVKLPSERTEITLTPEQIQAITGTYSLAPGVDLSVMVEDGKLMTQLTGQPKLPIFAESPTLLFLKVVDAQLEFALGPDGKATQVTLHQGGRDQVAKRK
jgi:CubicO group peptidase (beta-lactamase class C family)